MQRTWPSIVVVALAAFAALGARLAAQPVSPAEAVDANRPDESAPRASADAPLRTRQNQIRQRFAELEKLLLRMAELTAPTDPRRAALLRRAVAQSKQRDVDHQFEELVKLLGQRRLARALSGQDDVQRDLAGLLDLLLSEDRGKRIESEKERIRQYLKRVNKIIKEQKSLRGQTARGGDTQPLAQRQGELSEKTGKLAKDMESNDAEKQLPDESDADAERDASEDDAPNSNDSPDTGDRGKSDKSDRDQGDKEGSKSDKSELGEKGDNPPDRGESEKEDQPSDQPGEPSEGDAGQQPSEDKPGRSQDQPPMPGQPSQGQGESSDSPPSDNNPAQRRLEQAEQRMREAQEKLEQAKREEAAEKEAEALAELERAKAELEEILRQLREEEMARMLAMLEGRFRKMLDAQVEVYEGSKRVDRVPEAQRDRDDEIEAGRLSRKEAQIVVAADKCLILLREEGSAVAFPEAVVEMREDMQQVVERLARAEVGTLTQAIETDIIAALEEMISALKKAQRDMEDKQQQPNQGQVAGGEPPLVDALAELRMIRALQMRVNKRTQRYAALSEKDQADTPELLEALRRLAEREERIHRVTRDIVVGRNR